MSNLQYQVSAVESRQYRIPEQDETEREGQRGVSGIEPGGEYRLVHHSLHGCLLAVELDLPQGIDDPCHGARSRKCDHGVHPIYDERTGTPGHTLDIDDPGDRGNCLLYTSPSPRD